MQCDDSIKTGFSPDSNTTVLLVRAFAKGEPLILTSEPTEATPIALNDLCMVKLNVGPGNPGAPGSPSTSAGIGIEIWLPSAANWNERIHVAGNGGWAGGAQGSTTELANSLMVVPAQIAGLEGAVSASNDTGHSFEVPGYENPAGGNGSFSFRPDGTLNTALWYDFSRRGIHEMAVKTKALTEYYYGRPAKYSYWDGFSTGGRQGMMEAQASPEDFDGILVGAPAINWSRFITSYVYPSLLIQQQLDGVAPTKAQLDLISNAAIAACGTVGGQDMGYIVDPFACTYNPETDRSILCGADGGNAPDAACVTRALANVVNKSWYGLTLEGTVPDPRLRNEFSAPLADNQRWFGHTRGTDLQFALAASPMQLGADMVAHAFGDPTLATPALVNETGDGADGWKDMSIDRLNEAFDINLEKQDLYAGINTDNPDLRPFRNHGGKLLMYHGLADQLIPPQGSIHYYERVIAEMGGLDQVQDFYRLYLVPGMAHDFANGTSNPDATPPLPTRDQLYAALTAWVERGEAPGRLQTVALSDASRTGAICPYPARATYGGGSPTAADSYQCR